MLDYVIDLCYFFPLPFFFLSSFAPPVTLTVTECGGKPTQKRLKCVMSDNTKSTQGMQA